MKHNRGSKIKQEHHIMSDFAKILMQISEIEDVQRIIPGRISRQQKGSSDLIMSLSYPTDTGLKYLLKKGSTVQECFIICSAAYVPTLTTQIQALCVSADIIYKG